MCMGMSNNPVMIMRAPWDRTYAHTTRGQRRTFYPRRTSRPAPVNTAASARSHTVRVWLYNANLALRTSQAADATGSSSGKVEVFLS